jgi:ferredoxin
MGKYRVVIDMGLCQGHSVCAAEAPQLFRIVDTGMAYPQAELVHEVQPPDQIGNAENAAEYCPNGAITIVYEDD